MVVNEQEMDATESGALETRAVGMCIFTQIENGNLIIRIRSGVACEILSVF